jgi:RNA 2',3'-cyclic 3'-phosphodiesterase
MAVMNGDLDRSGATVPTGRPKAGARMFVAVVPPPDAVADLADAVRAHTTVASDLRWTPSSQWHVTLAFLPSVSERALQDLTERLRRAAARRPVFEMRLAGAGAFSNSRRARVLWAGVQTDDDTLEHLAQASRAAARKSGIDTEERRFHPHVTLARSQRPVDVTAYVTALSAFRTAPWTVEHVELIASHLGQGEGGRPRYETVQRFGLGTKQLPNYPNRSG